MKKLKALVLLTTFLGSICFTTPYVMYGEVENNFEVAKETREFLVSVLDMKTNQRIPYHGDTPNEYFNTVLIVEELSDTNEVVNRKEIAFDARVKKLVQVDNNKVRLYIERPPHNFSKNLDIKEILLEKDTCQEVVFILKRSPKIPGTGLKPLDPDYNIEEEGKELPPDESCTPKPPNEVPNVPNPPTPPNEEPNEPVSPQNPPTHELPPPPVVSESIWRWEEPPTKENPPKPPTVTENPPNPPSEEPNKPILPQNPPVSKIPRVKLSFKPLPKTGLNV